VPSSPIRTTHGLGAAWREGAGLVGVIAASVIPYALGAPSLVALFLVSLAVALVLLVRHAPRPAGRPDAPAPSALRAVTLPLATSRFRWLLAVFVANGIAAAIPASLVLFFVADRLELESRVRRLPRALLHCRRRQHAAVDPAGGTHAT